MGGLSSELTSAFVGGFFSSVIGEIVRKGSSFIIDAYSKTPTEEKIETIKQLTSIIKSAIEESRGKRIKNEQLLQSLKTLIDTVNQTDYLLETFEYCRLLKLEENDKNPKNFIQSPYNLAKRIRTSVENATSLLVIGEEEVNELDRAIQKLECAIYVVSEFRKSIEKCETTVFRTIRTPSRLEENRVFSRQIEIERITNFLFTPTARDDSRVDLLPILGTEGMGKTTLALHACNNETVQNHFSLVIFVSVLCMETKSDLVLVLRKILDQSRRDHSLQKEDNLFRLSALVKRQLKTERFLIVLDDVLDVNEMTWSVLHDCLSCGKEGSKVIAISSSKEAVMKFGPKSMELSSFSKEEYWLFFKEFAFGVANIEDHPKLALIGREIAKRMHGSLLAAKILGFFLRDNLQDYYWCKVLKKIIEHELWMSCTIFDICNLVLELMPGRLRLLRVSYGPSLTGNEIDLDCLEEKLNSGYFVSNKKRKRVMDLQSNQFSVLVDKTVLPGFCMYHTFDVEVC